MIKIRNFFGTVGNLVDQITKSRYYRAILAVVILAFGCFSVIRWKPVLVDSWELIKIIPIWAIFALVASRLIMHYIEGIIYYYSLHKKGNLLGLWRVGIELNFINTALPYGEAAGFIWFARGQKSKEDRSARHFAFLMRYAVSILTNHLLSLIAIRYLFQKDIASFNVFSLVAGFNMAFICGCIIAIILLAKKSKYNFQEITTILVWAMIFSVIEDSSFWIIAASLGSIEYLPAIFVGTVAGDILGSISPLPAGIGTYELPMISSLYLLGMEPSLATAVVLAGRVLMLATMLPIGFVLAFFSALSEGKKSIRSTLDAAPRDE